MTDKLDTPAVEIQGLNRTTNLVKISARPEAYSQVTRKLRPYKSIPYLFRPTLEQVADYVRTTMIPRTFEQQGPGWARLSQRTMIQRMRDGFSPDAPILIQTGDLFAELTEKSHPKHVEIIKTGKMARIEIGGSSAKFIENQTGTGLPNLPPRPMIPGTGWLQLPDHDKKELQRIVERALYDRVNRA